MIPKKVVKLTIPLFPYLQKGRRKPLKTKRIRPQDALNPAAMIKEIRTSEILALNAAGSPWSLVSVYSAYSPDVHVMLIETSSRYVSGPEVIPDARGDYLMKLWAATLNLIARRKTAATIHTGYNWSPRSWGEEEEKTGFQSIPTKWHPHLWGWPALGKRSVNKAWSAGMVDIAFLSLQERRLLGENNYAKPFGLLIKKRMSKKFSKGGLFNKLFPLRNWIIDDRGIHVRFNKSVSAVLKTPGFFGQVLKPLAGILEQIARELTEVLTTMSCKDIDGILSGTSKLRPEDLRQLRAAPAMRDEKDIKKVFKQRGYPPGLLEALYRPVRDRCSEKGNPADWWRKGFGYALVLNGPAKGKSGELRIMPGVFLGSGGVVEAEGFILRRPENRKFSDAEIRTKSEDLRNLAEGLKGLGFR